MVDDNDKQTAGKVAFVGVEPYYAKAKTIYAKAGTTATVKVGRIQGGDGPVTVRVQTNPSTVLGGDVSENGVLAWGNRNAAIKTVTVDGLVAGRTTTLSLVEPTSGLKTLSASNTVKIVAVAADAPEFAASTAQTAATRYVAFSNAYPVVSVPDGTTKLTFTKLSGTLPAGLKATWDPIADALVIQGVPTAKAGIYTPVYQVKAGRKAGLTLALTIMVQDLTKPDTADGEALNPALAKTRTFNNIPLYDTPSTNRMVGTLKLTMPANGRLSAKLLTADGTTSFSTRNWSKIDGEGVVYALLVARKSKYNIEIAAWPDGMVSIVAMSGSGTNFVGMTSGRIWSKSDSAKNWRGRYTVALRNVTKTVADMLTVVPLGHGYLTLKMTSPSAYNAGTMVWAGHLPNGTVLSGRATLERDDDGHCEAYLPVFTRTRQDVLSASLKITAGAAGEVEAANPCQAVSTTSEAYFTHSDAAITYQIDFDVYGGGYGTTFDFGAYYSDNYSMITPEIIFDVSGLNEFLSIGTPQPIEPIGILIGQSSLKIERNNPVKARLSFNRSTGVVSGTFKFPYARTNGKSATITATYRGVMLIGWGSDCGCGDSSGLGDDVKLPFVSGAFWVTDKVKLPSGKSVSVKNGGAMEIGQIPQVEN